MPGVRRLQDLRRRRPLPALGRAAARGGFCGRRRAHSQRGAPRPLRALHAILPVGAGDLLRGRPLHGHEPRPPALAGPRPTRRSLLPQRRAGGGPKTPTSCRSADRARPLEKRKAGPVPRRRGESLSPCAASRLSTKSAPAPVRHASSCASARGRSSRTVNSYGGTARPLRSRGTHKRNAAITLQATAMYSPSDSMRTAAAMAAKPCSPL